MFVKYKRKYYSVDFPKFLNKVRSRRGRWGVWYNVWINISPRGQDRAGRGSVFHAARLYVLTVHANDISYPSQQTNPARANGPSPLARREHVPMNEPNSTDVMTMDKKAQIKKKALARGAGASSNSFVSSKSFSFVFSNYY